MANANLHLDPLESTILDKMTTPTSPDIRLLHGLSVPLRDGVRLSADVYLPAAAGPFPTIVTRTPYESGRDVFIELGVWWAERGYAFAVQDCRGRFESEGTFHAYFPDIEDGYDTLAWLSTQPWCNGHIGSWGRSYGALTQWLTAPLQSPHLACMAPHVICDDFFSDCHYIGGAFQLLLSLGAATIWETNLATVAGSQSRRLFQNRKFWDHLPLIDLDERAIGRKIPYWREWLEHPTYDAYWERCNTMHRHNRIAAPALQQCGWFDPYTAAGFRNYNGMVQNGATPAARGQQRMLVGPWSHEVPDSTRMGDLDFGADSLLDIREYERRWFDWQLKGVSGGIADEPPIRLFVGGVNQWRFEHEWPLSRTRYDTFYLHSGGHANSVTGDGSLSTEPPDKEPPDHFTYDPAEPVPTLGGNLSVRLMTTHAEQPLEGGPVDQQASECRGDVLVYTSEVLKRDLEITGPISVTLYAESSARDTDFTARLNDVDQQHTSRVISEGILRARYRHSLESTELLEPGEVTVLTITLCPACHVFLAGHRLRIAISSSNFPRFSRNLNTGEDVATGTRMQSARQTVLHTHAFPSHIVLPIIES
ncbi:MAG: CocE/NonD family hydrolase [Pirellulales bacterium]|nr:CocE/NonD family hydrolase [Pirellulales bacterium]